MQFVLLYDPDRVTYQSTTEWSIWITILNATALEIDGSSARGRKGNAQVASFLMSFRQLMYQQSVVMPQIHAFYTRGEANACSSYRQLGNHV